MESLHLFFLAVSAIGILISDHDGWRYFTGKSATLPAHRLLWQHRIVWTGLAGLILTGAWMVWPLWSYYIGDTAFRIKMAFVGVLILNGLCIGPLLHTAVHTPFRALSRTRKSMLLLSGCASVIGWIGTASIGFLWL